MHKLYFASPSPYARKVRVLILEKKLTAKVEMIECAPFDKPDDLIAFNPLSKVPTMVADDGQALFGSQVIAEYLDALSAPRLVPAEGRPRWDALRRQALADGILDAGVSIVLEGRRPESERSLGWVQRQTEVVVRALDAFEGEISRFGDGLTIGHIALGCALGWLDFRIPGHEWRSRCPRLAAWFAAFSQRPSMLATKPA